MPNAPDGQDAKKPRPGRVPLYASLAVFLVYAANIVIGKVASVQGATTTPGLGDVGEFLTLFVAVVLFIAACLAHERENLRGNDFHTTVKQGDNHDHQET